MRVYLAGNMAGIEDLNRPAFAEAAKRLRIEGHEVFNPAAANLEGMPLGKIMAYELTWLCEQAEALAIVPGSKKRGGYKIEFDLAKYIGLEIIYL